jgi:steroid delta-isomerase-like uncharacterized protein
MERFFARHLQAWHDRDVEALASHHAPDSIVESLAHGLLTTPSAIRQVYATWFEAFPDLTVDVEDLLIDGVRGAVIFTCTGHTSRPDASSRRIEIRGVFAFTVREGRIIREKRIYDSTALLMQLGLVKDTPH